MKRPSRSPVKLLRLLLAAALAGAVGACGYRFSAAGGPLPKGAVSVQVPTFRNRTPEAGFEALLTHELREELERTGHGAGGSADASLDGVVETIGAMPLALKAAPPATGGSSLVPYNPGLYQTVVTVSVKLVRGAELLAQIDHLQLTEPYLPSDDLATNEANRRLALRRLAHALAKEIVQRLAAQ
ncbi:MAG TPA: LPS assembly lipoprotein LptE [Myxococcales bacterium]|nr:LPS assembly lipoprotein LptE [Myxococcales bacterium]